jgi:hypothetical protein
MKPIKCDGSRGWCVRERAAATACYATSGAEMLSRLRDSRRSALSDTPRSRVAAVEWRFRNVDKSYNRDKGTEFIRPEQRSLVFACDSVDFAGAEREKLFPANLFLTRALTLCSSVIKNHFSRRKNASVDTRIIVLPRT